MACVTLAATVGNGSASFQVVSSHTDESGSETSTYTTYQFKAKDDPGWTFARWEMRSRYSYYTSSGGGSSGTTEWSSWSSVSPLTTFTSDFLCRNEYDYGGTWGSGYTSYEYEVRAVFTEIPISYYTVTTEASPVAGGTTTGDGQYSSGSTCTVTATPANGYEFVRWELSTGPTSDDASLSFTVTQNTTATAYFRQYTGLPLYGSSGTILHGSSGTVLYDG